MECPPFPDCHKRFTELCQLPSYQTTLRWWLQHLPYILQSCQSYQNPTNDSDKITKWSSDRSYLFSDQKTVMVIFRKRSTRPILLPSLHLQNFKIIIKCCTKFFGLTFDNKTTWTPHIKILRAKFFNALNILKYRFNWERQIFDCNTTFHYTLMWNRNSRHLLRNYRVNPLLPSDSQKKKPNPRAEISKLLSYEIELGSRGFETLNDKIENRSYGSKTTIEWIENGNYGS